MSTASSTYEVEEHPTCRTDNPAEPWHGTTGGYTNHRCRGPLCRDVWANYNRGLRALRRLRGLTPDDDRHGTDNGYTNYGCRCERCARAHHDLHAPTE